MNDIKKIKQLIVAAVVLALAVAFIMPSSALLNKKTTVSNTVTKHMIQKVSTYASSQALETLSDGDDVQLTGIWNEGDDVLPSITMDKKKHVVISWTDELDSSTSQMGFLYADDPTDPAAWLGGTYTFQDGPQQLAYLDTAYIRGSEAGDYSGLYGTLLAIDTEQSGTYLMPDITEDTNWSFLFWTDSCPEPAYAAIADGPYYYQPYTIDGTPPYWGPVNMYIYRFSKSGYDIANCTIYVNYNIRGGETASSAFFFDAQSHLKTAPASDPDLVGLDGRFHMTWQYHNESLALDKIVWKKIDPNVEGDIEYTPFQQYIANGTNPAIAGYGSNVAIVYTTTDGVNSKLNCAHSSDDGGNWTITTITQGDFVTPPEFPDIYAYKDRFHVSYIQNGNLYLLNSTDGGTIWGTAVQINDVDGTVVVEENAVDLHKGGIVWVDRRGDTKDLFYQQIFAPEPEPKIDLSFVKGFGTSAKATIKNTGEAAATNIQWQMKITGGILGRINSVTTGNSTFLAAGAEIPVTSQGMIFGLGAISLSLTATCSEEISIAPATTDGTQLFIFTSVK